MTSDPSTTKEATPMPTFLIHDPAEPVGEVLQLCSRCGIVLLDFTEPHAYPEGQDTGPHFWRPGQPILRSLDGGFTASIDVLETDRPTDDETDCAAAS